MKKRNKNLSFQIFLVVLFLVVIGLMMVWSSSAPYSIREFGSPYRVVIKQFKFAIMGMVLLVVASFIDYRIYKKLAIPIFLFALIMCGLVFTRFALPLYNARRWILLFGVTIMPSDFMKIASVILLSAYLSSKPYLIRDLIQGLLVALVITGASIALVYKQPDLSTSMVILVSHFAIYFVAGMNLLHLVPLGLLGSGFFAYAVLRANSAYSRLSRITAFLNPLADFRNTGWQLSQAMFAVSTGSILGLGIGKSRQKFLYLSEAHNDFIFAIICEEMGLVGALAIASLYLLLAYFGIQVANRCKNLFGKYLATGITVLIFIQAMFNMLVSLGMVPPTGLVLPFISAGGTSLMISLGMIGVLLNIAKQSEGVKR